MSLKHGLMLLKHGLMSLKRVYVTAAVLLGSVYHAIYHSSRKDEQQPEKWTFRHVPSKDSVPLLRSVQAEYFLPV